MSHIDKQATIDAIRQKAKEELVDVNHYVRSGVQLAMAVVMGMPEVQPKRMPGKWIPVTNGRGGHECSLCHSYAPSYKSGDEWLTDYCPHCGVRMEDE